MMFESDLLAERVDQISLISHQRFKVITSILFSIALVSVACRVVLKLHHKRCFRLDDYILFFGTGCLIAAFGMLNNNISAFYIGPAIQVDPSLIFVVPHGVLLGLRPAMSIMYAILTLLWTATFSVKFSFLAFFYDIVKSLRTIKHYYFATVGLTFFSYVLVVISPFIVCPQFSMSTGKGIPLHLPHSNLINPLATCLVNPNTKLLAALTYTGTAMDCITDLMIASIPIIILHQIRILSCQKLAVGFTSLTLIMIPVSVARSTRIQGPAGAPEDVSWMMFWVYCESAVAVLLISLTALRTFFNQKREEENRRQRWRQFPICGERSDCIKKPQRSLFRVSTLTIPKRCSKGAPPLPSVLPPIPTATLHGLWAYLKEGDAVDKEFRVEGGIPTSPATVCSERTMREFTSACACEKSLECII
ncbi:hypothetical protein BU24DRAFT_370855 [Aaosphaeria arxii CBS 175.79]|uniref:Rhodopsin domain-containing protein n=1 Tax=Aaosphaeria arxii CBS 175.79 TaxID=1450172 RepID=A0A6A5XN06_9PLEO|nr:uncharacterized protein BU24DRAFT_370855 [Aaosphaeria arxii CBS 175.79]KAF2014130.1 hypothetical protein BU24DRAFT_370855 [Aaosphaeria arxii CBS 175.79]